MLKMPSRLRSELDALTAGPDQFELRAAQRDVDRAQTALTAAQAETGASSSQKDAAVAAARIGVVDAADRLAKLKQPPKPAAVTAATNKAENAAAAVTSAQERLTVLKQPPDQLSVDTANAAVAAAQATLNNDQSKLIAMRTGPGNDQLQAASSAVEAAQLGVDMAKARRDELNSRPTPAELALPQQQLADALDSLRKARTGGAAGTNPANILQQKDIDQLGQQIGALEAQLEATRLRAPFTASSPPSRVGQGTASRLVRPSYR